MQQSRSFVRSLPDPIPSLAGVLLVLSLAVGCAPGSAIRLVGMGCSDPSCEHEEPQTAKVLGCVGEGCNEPPPPEAARRPAPPEVSPPAAPSSAAAAEPEVAPATAEPEVATAAAEPKSPSPPTAAAESEAADEAPEDAKEDESSDWKLKVYYEPYQRD